MAHRSAWPIIVLLAATHCTRSSQSTKLAAVVDASTAPTARTIPTPAPAMTVDASSVAPAVDKPRVEVAFAPVWKLPESEQAKGACTTWRALQRDVLAHLPSGFHSDPEQTPREVAVEILMADFPDTAPRGVNEESWDHHRNLQLVNFIDELARECDTDGQVASQMLIGLRDNLSWFADRRVKKQKGRK